MLRECCRPHEAVAVLWCSKLKQCLCSTQGLAPGESIYCPEFIIRKMKENRLYLYCKSCTGPEHSIAVRRKFNACVIPDKEAIFFFFVTETSCIFEIREPIAFLKSLVILTSEGKVIELIR